MRPFKSPECGFVDSQSFALNYQSILSAFLQLLLNLSCFDLDSAEIRNKELIFYFKFIRFIKNGNILKIF